MTNLRTVARPDPASPPCRGGLYQGFEAYRTHSDGVLRDALKTSLVVFDTNVLLNLYRYNDQTRASIIEVMAALQERLWIPHQVLEEFWRNRERALTDPLGQVRQSSAELEKLRSAAVDQLRMWVNRAALSADASGRVEQHLCMAFEEAQSLLDDLIDERAIQRARSTQHDPVLSLIETVLDGRVGPPMSERDHAAAVKEGQRRAAAGEPPGFADEGKSSRGNEGAAGDYLVWEQVLVEASSRAVSSVVFVTGDVKRDWWRYEGGNARGPRVELAREMGQRCGAHLYMIRPDKLLELADALAVSVRPGSVEDVERTTRIEKVDEPDDEPTGWTREALDVLLRRLSVQAPVQEATIRFAADQGGFIGRDDVYRLGEYEPTRQLKGFTRPVNRLVQELRDSGDIPEGAADVLAPVYDRGTHGFGWADGFRVPNEIVALLNG